MKHEEHQTIEYKESWHDKYLAWICGYANAQGGTIYFGIEDGTKKPIGLKDANSLMESIPNKIRDTMGIVADVVLLRKSGKDVIEEKCVSCLLPRRIPLPYQRGEDGAHRRVAYAVPFGEKRSGLGCCADVQRFQEG